MSNRVFVTGMSAVSNYGCSLDKFWEAISSGVSAIKPWQPSGVEGFPVKYAASINTEELISEYSSVLADKRSFERRFIFGFLSSVLAARDADIGVGQLDGALVCSGVPGISDEDLSLLVGVNEDEALASMLKSDRNALDFSGARSGSDALVGAIARHHKIAGLVGNISGACAGATQAIGHAYHAVARGECSRVLAGGADSVLNLRTMSGLYLLGATSTNDRLADKLCRPFDKQRSGLVAGEGGAMLILESERSAMSRNAKIYAEVVGYGSSLDAYKVTAPEPRGSGAAASMNSALAGAGLKPSQVAYINAHGTSTPLNDVMETQAIKNVFGEDANNLLISSTKSMIGHWIAAAGAPEAIATVLAIKNKIIPPTINLDEADKKCDLNYVPNLAVNSDVEYAISNSFGFGGLNASIVFARVH